MHKAERSEAAFLAAAEHFAVEPQRLIEVRHTQDDVIDANDVDCTHALHSTPHAGARDGRRFGLDRRRATPHDARSFEEPMTKADYERAVRQADECGRRVVAHEPCPVCDARDARIAYEVEGLASRLVTCETCGTGRLFPLPSEAEIETFYPEAYYGDPSDREIPSSPSNG